MAKKKNWATKLEYTYENNKEILTQELQVATKSNFSCKDILIVVKDQLDCIRNCLDSIYQHTDHFHVYIWDNGSRPDAADYLEVISQKPEITLVRAENNQGFIVPNNRLVEMGDSPYIIALNSDTVVKPCWDTAMVNWIEENPQTAIVGYLGGFLDEKGRGMTYGFGNEVDYVCGWCFCMRRCTYEKYGFFDEENLKFAYCEDSDLSLRLKEAKQELYALHLDLVHHLENQTVKELIKERALPKFDGNYAYIQTRWRNYLEHLRFYACLSVNTSE